MAKGDPVRIRIPSSCVGAYAAPLGSTWAEGGRGTWVFVRPLVSCLDSACSGTGDRSAACLATPAEISDLVTRSRTRLRLGFAVCGLGAGAAGRLGSVAPASRLLAQRSQLDLRAGAQFKRPIVAPAGAPDARAVLANVRMIVEPIVSDRPLGASRPRRRRRALAFPHESTPPVMTHPWKVHCAT
jgi:hypothetical protein